MTEQRQERFDIGAAGAGRNVYTYTDALGTANINNNRSSYSSSSYIIDINNHDHNELINTAAAAMMSVKHNNNYAMNYSSLPTITAEASLLSSSESESTGAVKSTITTNNKNAAADADAADNNDNNNDSDEMKEVTFRAYQAENWTDRYEELLEFRNEHGHCLVPHFYPKNQRMAKWIKCQRYQYKLKMNGKRATITNERILALDSAGFVWDSHKAVWAERLEELKQFKKRFGHCNVPSRYQSNYQLAIWVKRQRRQRKFKLESKTNCMGDDREKQLDELGFVWDVKKNKELLLNEKQHRQGTTTKPASSEGKHSVYREA